MGAVGCDTDAGTCMMATPGRKIAVAGHADTNWEGIERHFVGKEVRGW